MTLGRLTSPSVEKGDFSRLSPIVLPLFEWHLLDWKWQTVWGPVWLPPHHDDTPLIEKHPLWHKVPS